MPVRGSEAHSVACLEEEAAALLEGLRDVGSEIDLSQMWTRAYGIMEKEIIQQHGLDGKKFAGRQVHTKVVEVKVLPSRGTNHVKVQGDEAIVMRCGRKADRIISLSGWLTRQAQGGVCKEDAWFLQVQ